MTDPFSISSHSSEGRSPSCNGDHWFVLSSASAKGVVSPDKRYYSSVLQSFIGASSESRSDLSGTMLPMTPREKEAVVQAARLFRDMGASQVFMFGSAAKGHLRPDSDIDMAVSGLPPRVYFSAVNQASELVGRPVDLMDLDDDTPLVRYVRANGDLVRVD
jgi:predicted nucleotidyltransferase